MFILTSLLITLIYLIWRAWVAIGIAGDARNKRNISEDVFKWAQEHEDEWLCGTDIIVRENGKLMYYPHGYNEFSSHPVHYGWDSGHYQYGLIYAGRVVFNYEQVWWAKANGNRVQYKDGERIINLGPKRGVTGDVYKVVGKEKYYDHNKDKEIWIINKGTYICKFTDDRTNDLNHKERLEELREKAWQVLS